MKRSAIAAAVAAVSVYPWVHAQLFGLGSVYLLTPGLLHGAKQLGGHTGLVLLHGMVSFALGDSSEMIVLPLTWRAALTSAPSIA